MKPKRLISLLVAVCMMITMLPLSAVTAFAEDTSPSTRHEAIVDGHKYTYTVNEDGDATITGFYDPEDYRLYDLDIPDKLDKYTVTAIGNRAFFGQYCLSNVTIPQSVKSIGREAFYGCTAMKSLTIKDAATSIGDSAFRGCDWLTTVKLGEHITTIGEAAFLDCERLNNVTIPDSVTSIGDSAFARCYNLETLKLGKNIETIGDDYFVGVIDGVFFYCTNLSKIIIPEKVKTIERNTFVGCSNLESITLPAGLTSFKDSLENYPADCVFYYNGNEHDAQGLFGDKLVGDKLAGHKFLCLCNVTFDANGGTLTDKGGNQTDHAVVSAYKTQKINADDLTAIPNPTRAGYKFTGWYTEKNQSENDQPFNVNEIITKDMTEDITFYARWELAPKAPVCHPLTVTGGIVTVKNGDKDVTDTLTVTTDETTGKKTYSVPDGATVTVTLDKTLIPEGMVFDIWSTGKLSLPLGQDYKAESITFPMSSDVVDIAAQYRDASIEDDGPNVLGTAAIIGTAAVGTAVLGYQAYSLGTEFAGKLMALPYFPSNRSALAMMLWEDAGKPMPESELLYPDVGQEERDMDLQHAARWAMENELIPDLNDEGTAPEEMKFFPANPVSKLDVLNAWQKAQELKNN